MSRYWTGRLLQAIPLLFAVSLAVFAVLHLAPGDPATLLADPAYLTESQRAAIHRSLGLDDALPIQYVRTMAGIVTGRLQSFRTTEPTLAMLGSALPTTAAVGLIGLALATVAGVVLGAAAATRPGGYLDRLLGVAIVSAVSVPTFVVALFALRLFSEEWHLLPASGIRPIGATTFDPIASLPHLVLPVLVTAFPIAAILARYTRDAVAEALAEEYVRTAHGKGLSGRVVLRRHVLRNALIAVVSVVGTIIPLLLGGSVIVESLFGLPGVGRITVQAALQRDYPVVMTTTLFAAVLVVAANLVTDFVYGLVDPRIRLA
ncbi:MAG TPA: ABC transporter permease [Candidatus Limnocylindria bacterium]|nr:ABC transporter permease [Candidatus Limnocylindria bacterium]